MAQKEKTSSSSKIQDLERLVLGRSVTMQSSNHIPSLCQHQHHHDPHQVIIILDPCHQSVSVSRVYNLHSAVPTSSVSPKQSRVDLTLSPFETATYSYYCCCCPCYCCCCCCNYCNDKATVSSATTTDYHKQLGASYRMLINITTRRENRC